MSAGQRAYLQIPSSKKRLKKKKEIKITYILLSAHKRNFCCELELEEWTIRLHGRLRISASVNISRLHPPFVRFHPTFGGGRSLCRHGADIQTGSTKESVDTLRWQGLSRLCPADRSNIWCVLDYWLFMTHRCWRKLVLELYMGARAQTPEWKLFFKILSSYA